MKNLSTPGCAALVIALAALGACDRRDADLAAQRTERAAREAARATERVAHEAARATENAAHEAARATEHAAPGPATMAFGEAVSDIAEARCDRELRCDHVGRGRRFESPQTCRATVREDFADDLNPADCPAGVDRAELDECLSEVRNEDCGNPLDTLERVVACRTSDLCLHTRAASKPSP